MKKSPEEKPKKAVPEEVIAGEVCPFCHEKTLVLMDTKKDIPYFGTCFLFAMDCSNCGYHKSDIETESEQEPSKYTIEIDSEKDMSIRVVKSSNATIRLPHIGDIQPGPTSNGYITNVEGVLNRMVKQLETIRDNEEEDEDARKKAKRF